jgi:hypothetical protein
MDQRRRRFRAGVEALEVRDLLSSSRFMVPAASDHHAGGPYLNLIVANQAAEVAERRAARHAQADRRAADPPPWFDPGLTQQLINQLYAPNTTTAPIQIGSQVFPPGTYAVPQPTQAEIRRQIFWAEFVGRYSVGAPRFSNQAATIHIFSHGRSVVSNQFANGRGQVLLFPPADPTAIPTSNDPVAGKTVGLVSLYPSDTLQSGSSLFLDAINLPGVASNDPSALDHGLPSRLQLLLDAAGISAGTYSIPAYTTNPPVQTDPSTGKAVAPLGGSGGAVAFLQGSAVIDLHYFPDNRLRAGAMQSGNVIVRIQGVINLNGVTNPLYQGIN